MINPYGMSLQDWADSTVPLLDRYGVTMRLDDPTQWREWARTMTDIPVLRRQGAPDPDAFDDWRAWAERLNEVLLPIRR